MTNPSDTMVCSSTESNAERPAFYMFLTYLSYVYNLLFGQPTCKAWLKGQPENILNNLPTIFLLIPKLSVLISILNIDLDY